MEDEEKVVNKPKTLRDYWKMLWGRKKEIPTTTTPVTGSRG